MVLFCSDSFLFIVAQIDPKFKVSVMFLTIQLVVKNQTCQWYFILIHYQLVLLHLL